MLPHCPEPRRALWRTSTAWPLLWLLAAGTGIWSGPDAASAAEPAAASGVVFQDVGATGLVPFQQASDESDRKSTRLNSSH